MSKEPPAGKSSTDENTTIKPERVSTDIPESREGQRTIDHNRR